MKKLPRALKLGLIAGSSATLIGLVSISAVACFNSPASEPLNNETTKYRQVANIQAEGFFSEHTGNYLRSLSYDFFLTNLINTYPSLNLNAATAHITQITYNYALENSMGQLEVWIKSPYNAQNNGIYFNIQDIKTQLPLPLPPPPTQTLYNLSLNQLFPNTVLDAQSLAKLTKANWTIALKAQGLIGSSYSVNQINITQNDADIFAYGLSNNNQWYTIEFVISLPWAVTVTNINKTTTVQALFNKEMSTTQFLMLKSQQILNALNTLLEPSEQINPNTVINANGTFNENVNLKTLNNLANNTSYIIITIKTNNITYTFTIQGFSNI